MNTVIEYFNNILKLDFSNLQKEFYQWQLNNCKEVKVVSYKSHLELNDIVEQFLNCHDVRIKQCYRNSALLSFFNNDFEYVEGMCNSIIPMEHAWNYYKPLNVYIDLTCEVLFPEDKWKDYTKIIQVSNNELLKAEAESPMNLIYYFYQKSCK